MAVCILKDNTDTYFTTFERGESLPFNPYPSVANMDLEDTRNGLRMVRKRGDAKKRFRILVENETLANAATAYGLFYTYVNFMANDFHYYPDETDLLTYYTVRLTEPFIRIERQGNGEALYTVEINCREE